MHIFLCQPYFVMLRQFTTKNLVYETIIYIKSLKEEDNLNKLIKANNTIKSSMPFSYPHQS